MSDAAVFLDRDGTLIEHYDYLTEVDQVALLPTAAGALRLLRSRGYKLICVTNQSAVARGMLTEETLGEIHDRLKKLLAEQGVYLDGLYYCPYHPEAPVEEYRRESELRKPEPGMLRAAAAEHDLDLTRSWMIGDDARDVKAGAAAGCRTILLETPGGSPLVQRDAAGDFQAVNLREAANIVIHQSHQAAAAPVEESVEEQEPMPETPVETEPEEKPADAVEPEREEEPETSETMPSGQETPVSEPEQHGVVMEQPEEPTPPVRKSKPAKRRKKGPDGKDSSRELLAQILREMRSQHRERRFSEFSVTKLMAGITQMIVMLFLVLAFWLHSGTEPQGEAVQNSLILALIFQTMTLTLLMMHR